VREWERGEPIFNKTYNSKWTFLSLTACTRMCDERCDRWPRWRIILIVEYYNIVPSKKSHRLRRDSVSPPPTAGTAAAAVGDSVSRLDFFTNDVLMLLNGISTAKVSAADTMTMAKISLMFTCGKNARRRWNIIILLLYYYRSLDGASIHLLLVPDNPVSYTLPGHFFEAMMRRGAREGVNQESWGFSLEFKFYN